MEVKIKEVMFYEGKAINEYSLISDNGFSVDVISLGATVTGIHMADRNGIVENVVLKYKDYEEYKVNAEYIGSIIGRNSGRIGDGKFTLEGEEYQLNTNNNGNTLHGGIKGFNLRIWECETVVEADEAKLICKYFSQEGEENFPGNVDVKVVYTINNKNQLKISYEANTDKTTIMNMTNHAYFNLSGDVKRNILEHTLCINAEKFIEVDEELIPTGTLLDVENTPFDFRIPKAIGRDIEYNHPQLQSGGGYDHPWALKGGDQPQVELYEEESGRGMRIYTDCSHVVMYSMNYPQGKELPNGKRGGLRDALCLETQSSPIGRNNTFIEGSILERGKVYNSQTTFEFYTK